MYLTIWSHYQLDKYHLLVNISKIIHLYIHLFVSLLRFYLFHIVPLCLHYLPLILYFCEKYCTSLYCCYSSYSYFKFVL